MIKTTNCLISLQLSLQCRFAKLVKKYTIGLKHTLCNDKILKDLRILSGLINSINNYDNRDVVNNTTDYNCITLLEINRLINKSFILLDKYE